MPVNFASTPITISPAREAAKHYEVHVHNDATFGHTPDYVAETDTLDEAMELAASLEKHYYVVIRGVPF